MKQQDFGIVVADGTLLARSLSTTPPLFGTTEVARNKVFSEHSVPCSACHLAFFQRLWVSGTRNKPILQRLTDTLEISVNRADDDPHRDSLLYLSRAARESGQVASKIREIQL